MKYVIIGAGGTGGAIGGFLARAGKDVTLIARGEHLEKIQTRGLYFETPDGEYMVHVPACTMDEYQGTPDVIFVCVKGYSLQDTIPFIQRVAAPHTIVIPILNIYGTGGKMQKQLPGITVTDGCIYIASEIKEPGTILMSGKIFRVVFGLRKGTEASLREQVMPTLEAVALDLELAGITPVLSEQIEKDALQKFSFVSPMAAVGAGYDVTAWAVQVPGALQDVFKALVKEVKLLSDAMDCSLPENIVDINMDIMNGLAPTATASMQRDIRDGKESELDGLVFEVVRMGKRLGVDVPVYEEISKRFPGMVEEELEEIVEEPVCEETVTVAEKVVCEDTEAEEIAVETVAEGEEDPFVWEEVEIVESEVLAEEVADEEPVEAFSFEETQEECEESEDENGNPRVRDFGDGSRFWTKTYDKFEAKVYLPESDPITDIVNFGFMTPYLLVFEEEKRTPAEAKVFADESGLAAIAAQYGGSVVFIYPTSEGGWEEAPEDLFASLISNTKISQYYHDGMAVMRNRFTGEWGESYIRGALLRSYLYGYGKSADYIAKNLLKTVEGDGLYGKGDITPVVCVLENLSVIPAPERRDIPVVSVGNSDEINEALTAGLDAVLVKERAEYINDFYSFMKKYRRMVGYLDEEPDLEEMGVEVEPDYCVVPTAADNRGDDADTTEHKIGYVAYYNRGIMNKEEVPLVLCFHGGGDSAMCMVALSDWHRVVAQNDFLLVSVENHLNSTATEMMHLLAHLKDKYSIDTERIYATGFSMGGCKSWDMFQEYPYVFAALAPMDATFDVGLNVYGQPVENINRTIPVPVFYVGGEQTPLPELPFQEEKCTNRMAYVLEVNKSKTKYNVKFEDRANWVNPIWGIDGDVICKAKDDNRGSVLTMHLFESENGCCYSVFGSGSPQQHEMRYLNCANAWKFFRHFRRLPNGELVGGKMDDVVNGYSEE